MAVILQPNDREVARRLEPSILKSPKSPTFIAPFSVDIHDCASDFGGKSSCSLPNAPWLEVLNCSRVSGASLSCLPSLIASRTPQRDSRNVPKLLRRLIL